MPGFDASGPLGQGQMTGWGQGRCQGDAQAAEPFGRSRQGHKGRQGYQGCGGRSRRRGFGPGGAIVGRRQAYAAAPAMPGTGDLQSLKREAEACTQNLERINTRIAELEATSQSTSGETETT